MIHSAILKSRQFDEKTSTRTRSEGQGERDRRTDRGRREGVGGGEQDEKNVLTHFRGKDKINGNFRYYEILKVTRRYSFSAAGGRELSSDEIIFKTRI